MKNCMKVLYLALALMMVFAFTACNGDDDPVTTGEPSTTGADDPNTTGDNNTNRTDYPVPKERVPGEQWGACVLTKYVPKPNVTIGETISLTREEKSQGVLTEYMVNVDWTFEEAKAYSASLIDAGFLQGMLMDTTSEADPAIHLYTSVVAGNDVSVHIGVYPMQDQKFIKLVGFE